VATKKRSSTYDTLDLDSPFLTEELFAGEAEEELHQRALALASQSAFQTAFEQVPGPIGSPEMDEPKRFEEQLSDPGREGWADYEADEGPFDSRGREEEETTTHSKSRNLIERERPQRVHRFRILDGAEKPLSDARYALHQNGASDAGALDAHGEGAFARVDPSRAFRLHVEGRVCAIVEGAILLVDEPGVEYGGQFVDWRLADATDADRAFWPHYTAERKAAAAGPFLFWQHDHITRRPIKLRRAYVLGRKTAVLQAVPVRIRVGPLIRFADEGRALVWIELETPGLAQLSQLTSRNAEFSRFTLREGA
jgi:hypothetical protein